ncbi:MAG: diguanylate cyclase domain-containing protein, partial [Acidobacteriota bacterium]
MLSKVLLVEDDPTVRLILKKRLEASGYQVFVANDGKQALDLVREEHISLIVSDWMMPEMDGLELCRRIKHDPRFHPSYFIMLTARGDKSDCIVGLEAGADDFLPKPIDEGELIARLKAGERLLSQQKSLKDLACTDPLTSLWNRRSFEDDLEREIAMSRRYHTPLSLLIIDIDLLKTINDHWGHTKGDEALRIIGKFLLQSLRRCDRAYRIGGDEFAVLLPQIQEIEVQKASERLKSDFADFMERHGSLFPFSLTFSIGSTTLSPGMEVTKEQLIQAADKNMYLDKMAKPGRRAEQTPPPALSGTVL